MNGSNLLDCALCLDREGFGSQSDEAILLTPGGGKVLESSLVRQSY